MKDLAMQGGHLSRMPYTHCNTRIVSLEELEIPEVASEKEYTMIYQTYMQSSIQNAMSLRDAVESVKHGIAPPVAFPTETVYGLGADATNEPAVAGIFAAKGRPIDNPLIVHAASAKHIERLTGEPIPEIYKTLVEKFWPGPLTILIPAPKASKFAKNVHPGQPTIGFRIPESKYARFFIAATDRPIAAPSANSSGKPSPTTAMHVMDDLRGKINFILDGGPCNVGVESTVVDGLHDPPLILRPGGVSQEELIKHGKEFNNRWSHIAIGYKRHDEGDHQKQSKPAVKDLDEDIQKEEPYVELNGAPRAPGMKYRHYAPEGRLILFSEAAVKANKPYETMSDIISQPEFRSRPCSIGIISCRWPEFAGLTCWDNLSNNNQDNRDFESKENESFTKIISKSPYRAITSTTCCIFDSSSRIEHRLFDVHVGPDIAALAQSLFGILRLFDDLKCDIIFAETVLRPRPRRQQQQEQDNNVLVLLDAVTDRLEKAAGERY